MLTLKISTHPKLSSISGVHMSALLHNEATHCQSTSLRSNHTALVGKHNFPEMRAGRGQEVQFIQLGFFHKLYLILKIGFAFDFQERLLVPSFNPEFVLWYGNF